MKTTLKNIWDGLAWNIPFKSDSENCNVKNHFVWYEIYNSKALQSLEILIWKSMKISKKTIPWNVRTENTMEKILKVNPLWANAKLPILVGLNAAMI